MVTEPLSSVKLHRDRFGLQKLLVAITTAGKLVALDSANGNIVWSTNLGMMTAQGSDLEVYGMWSVRDLGEQGSPTLAVVAVRTTDEVWRL